MGSMVAKGNLMKDRHAVLMVIFNTTPAQFAMTQRAIASVLAQDIGEITLWIANNGSTDAFTEPYLDSLRSGNIYVHSYPENRSPIAIGNEMSLMLFALGYDKVLGVPNDAILPPNAYRLMNEWPRGFICASQSDRQDVPVKENASAVSEATPMAVMLVRKWAYDAIVTKDGYFFDTGYFHYASDCDLALRMAACGIHGVQLDVEYYHFGSASWRLATPGVSRQITEQADIDRAYFEAKWGFRVDDARYGQCCGDINFRAIPKSVVLTSA
jgi:hypothetical protein